MKREQYIKNGKTKYHTTPKVFADYRHFIHDGHDQRIDNKYDASVEIQKQLRLLEDKNI